MKRVLIIGDSFGADWSVKYRDYPGWPSLLARVYSVVNLAQAGISEYKIYKQLLSVTDLDSYEYVIVSHTSPYRVTTNSHPVHANDLLHNNADLIFNDIEYHRGRWRNFFNRSLRSAYNFFLYHYHEDFQITTYRLYREKIHQLLSGKKVIVLSCLPVLKDFAIEEHVLECSELRETYPGLINHFSKEGNQKVCKYIINQMAKFH